MKAKKSLMALAAIAALSMSSCTQEEDLFVSDGQSSYDGNAVMFGTYLGNAPESRATTMDLAQLKKSNGFGVFASYTGQDVFGDTQTPNFMCNQKVHWVADNGKWEYAPIKYWPNNLNDKVSFFAYAPYISIPAEASVTNGFVKTNESAGITELSANTSKGDPKLKFVMTTEIDKQIDLLYAAPEIDLQKQLIDEKVQFNFKHALSRIGFKRVAVIDEVNNNEDGGQDESNDGTGNTPLDGKTTVIINEVVLKSAEFGTSGTLNLHTGEWSDVTSGEQIYSLNNKKDLQNATLTSANATKAMQLNNNDKYLMIMPRQSSINLILTVKYDVITEDENLSGKKSQITNEITSMFPFQFTAGKSYNFVLHIGLTSVKLDATETEWDGNQGEVEINVPKNNAVHLIYDANGGTFSNGSSLYIQTKDVVGDTKSATFEVLDMIPTNEGQSFSSYVNKDGETIDVGSRITVKKTDKGATETITAKWTDAGGGLG